MARFLFRVYVDALVKGNPIAVIFTIIWVSAVSIGPFYEGVSKRDTGALALMGLVGVLATIFLVIVIIDKRSNLKKNSPKKKVEKSSRESRR